MGLDPIPPDATLAELQALVRTTAAAFREGQQMVVASREHAERACVWITGLMGAGIFSVQGLLVGAPYTMRLSILVPWAAGIGCAVLSRLLSGELRNKDDMQHFKRLSMLGLLQEESDPTIVATNLRPILESAVLAKDPKTKELERWLVAVNAFFYLAHVFFAVGVVAAVTTIAVAGGPRP